MKIGMCAPATAASVRAVGEVGFDYIEMPVKEIAGMSMAEVNELRKAADGAGLPIPVCNFFSPAEIRLNEPGYSSGALRDYAERALERMAALGTGIVVVGSGKSRNLPEGYDYNRAMDSLRGAFALLGDIAGQHGITVVIEHLNRGESNIITSLAEGAQLCREVNHPHVRLLADLFHMALEQEDMQVIVENRDLLRHLHICNALGAGKRGMPRAGDGFDYGLFAGAVKRAGYDGGLSIEVFNVDLLKDCPASLALCRSLFS